MPTSNSRREAPDRNLAMELVRVTEAAAMAAGRWVGRGDKNGGDGAAVDAMRHLIGSVSMRGVVVIGEGEKDEAPMLYNGEEVGNGEGPWCDVAWGPARRAAAAAPRWTPWATAGARGRRAARSGAAGAGRPSRPCSTPARGPAPARARGAVDRVDRHVAPRALAVADLLAVFYMEK